MISFSGLKGIEMAALVSLTCRLSIHLSSIILENFKDFDLIIPEILEFIQLHSYKFGLVYKTLKT